MTAFAREHRDGADDDVPLPPVPRGSVDRCAIVGEHPTMREVYRLMARAAPTLVPVLLLGEAGTGRETIARCIHDGSPVANGPWVAVQCASDHPERLERELFGVESESDQGRMTREPGGFEQAEGGTIFLDDIGDLTPALQARLLRAVQDGEIERVGSGEIIRVHARIIASSTRDLRRAAQEGRFRDDLYFRLAIVTIHVPRLADRGEDLMLLVSSFVEDFGRRTGETRRVTTLSRSAKQALVAHHWVGNVRELRRVIDEALVRTSGDTLEMHDLPEEFEEERLAAQQRPEEDRPMERAMERGMDHRAMDHRAGDRMPERSAQRPTERRAGPGRIRGGRIATLAEVEARHIAFVLAETSGVIHIAAEVLGIHRNTLTRKIREHRL